MPKYVVEYEEDGKDDTFAIEIEATSPEDAEERFYTEHPDEWFTVYHVGEAI
jgi:hypothetical protein